jgi:acyl-CoA reductase-like NAD-dependent aldehyde dehydrogenase
MGPLVTRAHRDRVRGLVDQGVDEGAVLLEDGRVLEVPGGEQGFFLGPCLFDRVKPSMTIYKEEIFGPVRCLFLFLKPFLSKRWRDSTSPFINASLFALPQFCTCFSR